MLPDDGIKGSLLSGLFGESARVKVKSPERCGPSVPDTNRIAIAHLAKSWKEIT